jgi:predicted RNA-binding Zn-ribbon protein involved in translation (DUF1610 family)
MSKTCPVCNSTINNAKPDTILVCPNCENSLFAYKDKKSLKLRAFNLNIQFLGNSTIKNEFMDYNSYNPDEFDEDEDFE